MPILVLASFALQFFCLMHMVRTGRPNTWAWLILFGSVLGCSVYLITQVLPDLRNSPASRRAVRQVADRINPERQRQRIAMELDVADTVENRRRLADECLRLGDYANAVELYRSVLKGIYASDPVFLLKLAQAQAGLGEFAGARETLETLQRGNPGYRSDDGHLLYARCLEELGEHDRAVEEYDVLATSFPGEEARLRYGLMLKRLGRTAEARGVFQEMEKRAKVAPAYYRRKERDHLAAARRELTALGSS
ncbi:MAG: tetratricopeptide repeat protein [Tahibacter sp.]